MGRQISLNFKTEGFWVARFPTAYCETEAGPEYSGPHPGDAASSRILYNGGWKPPHPDAPRMLFKRSEGFPRSLGGSETLTKLHPK